MTNRALELQPNAVVAIEAALVFVTLLVQALVSDVAVAFVVSSVVNCVVVAPPHPERHPGASVDWEGVASVCRQSSMQYGMAEALIEPKPVVWAPRSSHSSEQVNMPLEI
ncbi:hypothetical protein VMCG_00321 [Cytospora schulzeri]|uniref:Uncharacterized protein n=1 Tax=Cytospora schulzeri TaxID=448051 RepID=A0A423X818_9PEZI|nr:hypothetical protein VMCG_00321 [Valsa malicola]